jgi:hypothetical protein
MINQYQSSIRLKTLEPLPCEQCIVLASCISRPAIECKKLYVYLCSYNRLGAGGSRVRVDLSESYWNAFRVNLLEERFRRKIIHLVKSNFAILFGPKET